MKLQEKQYNTIIHSTIPIPYHEFPREEETCSHKPHLIGQDKTQTNRNSP